MGLEQLLGNEALKERLTEGLRSGRMSHSYLLTGPEGSGKRTLARLLAAAMECRGTPRPCGVCPACHKVLSGNHPDVITVDDPDHKQVPVDCIRAARSELFIRPNEGEKKVLLIPRAGDMNPAAQNALLKVLEEPPSYGVFLLLAPSPEALLPTIRSRCAHLRLSPLPRAVLEPALRQRFPDRSAADLEAAMGRSGGFLGQAVTLLEGSGLQLPQVEQFAAAYAAHDTLGLAMVFGSMDKYKRNQLAPVLEELQRLLAQSLLARRGCPTLLPQARAIAEQRTAPELLAACRLVQEALDDCWANVGVGNICAGLLARL